MINGFSSMMGFGMPFGMMSLPLFGAPGTIASSFGRMVGSMDTFWGGGPSWLGAGGFGGGDLFGRAGFGSFGMFGMSPFSSVLSGTIIWPSDIAAAQSSGHRSYYPAGPAQSATPAPPQQDDDSVHGEPAADDGGSGTPEKQTKDKEPASVPDTSPAISTSPVVDEKKEAFEQAMMVVGEALQELPLHRVVRGEDRTLQLKFHDGVDPVSLDVDAMRKSLTAFVKAWAKDKSLRKATVRIGDETHTLPVKANRKSVRFEFVEQLIGSLQAQGVSAASADPVSDPASAPVGQPAASDEPPVGNAQVLLTQLFQGSPFAVTKIADQEFSLVWNVGAAWNAALRSSVEEKLRRLTREVAQQLLAQGVTAVDIDVNGVAVSMELAFANDGERDSEVMSLLEMLDGLYASDAQAAPGGPPPAAHVPNAKFAQEMKGLFKSYDVIVSVDQSDQGYVVRFARAAGQPAKLASKPRARKIQRVRAALEQLHAMAQRTKAHVVLRAGSEEKVAGEMPANLLIDSVYNGKAESPPPAPVERPQEQVQPAPPVVRKRSVPAPAEPAAQRAVRVAEPALAPQKRVVPVPAADAAFSISDWERKVGLVKQWLPGVKDFIASAIPDSPNRRIVITFTPVSDMATLPQLRAVAVRVLSQLRAAEQNAPGKTILVLSGQMPKAWIGLAKVTDEAFFQLVAGNVRPVAAPAPATPQQPVVPAKKAQPAAPVLPAKFTEQYWNQVAHQHLRSLARYMRVTPGMHEKLDDGVYTEERAVMLERRTKPLRLNDTADPSSRGPLLELEDFPQDPATLRKIRGQLVAAVRALAQVEKLPGRKGDTVWSAGWSATATTDGEVEVSSIREEDVDALLYRLASMPIGRDDARSKGPQGFGTYTDVGWQRHAERLIAPALSGLGLRLRVSTKSGRRVLSFESHGRRTSNRDLVTDDRLIEAMRYALHELQQYERAVSAPGSTMVTFDGANGVQSVVLASLQSSKALKSFAQTLQWLTRKRMVTKEWQRAVAKRFAKVLPQKLSVSAHVDPPHILVSLRPGAVLAGANEQVIEKALDAAMRWQHYRAITTDTRDIMWRVSVPGGGTIDYPNDLSYLVSGVMPGLRRQSDRNARKLQQQKESVPEPTPGHNRHDGRAGDPARRTAVVPSKSNDRSRLGRVRPSAPDGSGAVDAAAPGVPADTRTELSPRRWLKAVKAQLPGLKEMKALSASIKRSPPQIRLSMRKRKALSKAQWATLKEQLYNVALWQRNHKISGATPLPSFVVKTVEGSRTFSFVTKEVPVIIEALQAYQREHALGGKALRGTAKLFENMKLREMPKVGRVDGSFTGGSGRKLLDDAMPGTQGPKRPDVQVHIGRLPPSERRMIGRLRLRPSAPGVSGGAVDAQVEQKSGAATRLSAAPTRAEENTFVEALNLHGMKRVGSVSRARVLGHLHTTLPNGRVLSGVSLRLPSNIAGQQAVLRSLYKRIMSTAKAQGLKPHNFQLAFIVQQPGEAAAKRTSDNILQADMKARESVYTTQYTHASAFEENVTPSTVLYNHHRVEGLSDSKPSKAWNGSVTVLMVPKSMIDFDPEGTKRFDKGRHYRKSAQGTEARMLMPLYLQYLANKGFAPTQHLGLD